MDRSSVAGRAVGTGFDHQARSACEAFRATVSYLPPESRQWLIVIPSYPACIALNRSLTPEQHEQALAIGLGTSSRSTNPEMSTFMGQTSFPTETGTGSTSRQRCSREVLEVGHDHRRHGQG